jgi:hypothetical protein
MRIVVDTGVIQFTNEDSKTVSISDSEHGTIIGIYFAVTPPTTITSAELHQQNVAVNGDFTNGTLMIKTSAPLTSLVRYRLVSMKF